MSRFQLLPEKVINQIAAGEVVERPSSVVKELVENALDAKATWVEVEVQGGGLTLIKVMDNGEGMAPQDALLAIQKHATSKIYSVEDLSQLKSFGFRGEALASIASVSHFELSTRSKDVLSGISLKLKGGGTPKTVETGRPVGSTFSASNLFFNTPARLKFMKKQRTEENHIVMVVTTYALAFPEVGFKLTLDGKEAIHVSPANFTDRLTKVFGKETANSFLTFKHQDGNIRVKGVVSSPTITKPTRENMLYYVNRRWIVNASLGHAVMTAFHTLLPTRRFPVAVLFLELPEDQVDVNVHPTKREVKFAQDRAVYDTVVRAIRTALLSAPGSAKTVQSPALSEFTPTGTHGTIFESNTTQSGFLNEAPATVSVGEASVVNLYDRISQKHPSGGPDADSHGVPLEFLGLGKALLQARRIDPQVSLYNFVQLFNTFIVFQSDSEMFIADQHTVHERLNYERLMKRIREKALEIQPLLMPVTVELSAKESQVLRNNLETLMELGLETAPFGGNTFLIRSVPSDLAGKNLVSLVKDLVDDLSAQDALGIKSANRLDQVRERAANFLACRSSVMAGDKLNEEQMRRLIDQMRESNLPFTCPHGRPTILSIPLSDLYRRFDRH